MRVRQDRKDYERTCIAWLDKLRRNRARAALAGGEELVERYLDLSIRGWPLGATQLLRIAMQRVDRPRL